MEPVVTVLVVEDEAMLLLDYERALTEAGFAVIVVTSGTKAIRLLNEDNQVQGDSLTFVSRNHRTGGR